MPGENEGDIRSELEAAFAAASAGDDQADGGANIQAAPDGAAAAQAGGESQAAPAAGEENNANPEGGARARDATGKFAKAPEGAAQNETGAPAAQEPPSEAIPVPSSLPAAIKAKFKDLDPDVREAFANLEGSVQTAKAEWARKGERLNRYDQLIEPRREKLQLAGLDEFSAIQTLFAAQDLLERSPVEGLSYLARQYGVNLQQFVAQMTGQQGQAQSPLLPDAALQPVLARVQTLEQQLAQERQAAESAQIASATSEIEAFRADPKHLYFDNVAAQIQGLLASGQAKTLAQAYETAIWASPEIRPLLLREQQAAQARAQDEAAQRERAASARRAAGSVTGAPGSAAQTPPAGSTGSVREDLEAAWQDHAA